MSHTSSRMPVKRAIAAALLLVFAFARPLQAKLDEGQEAVPFTGNDFLTEGRIDLGEHLGNKVILLDFGSIYCSSCMVTVPNLIKLRKRYEEKDLVILNIYLDIYNPQRVIKFFRGFAKDMKLGLLIDEKLSISREYGIDTLPTTVIIDRAGIIRRRIIGYTEADEKEIDEIIENLVHEKGDPGVTGPVAEGGIEVFVPESFTKTKQDYLYIVGSISGEGTKDVAMKLNNLPPKVSKSKENIFHFRSPLSLAMNLIEVKGQVGGGKEKSQSVVMFRETPMRDDIRSELPVYHFHRDEETKPCWNCHQRDVSLKDKTTIQKSETCNSCHGALKGATYTHGPITVGGCLPCHDYQSFPNKYELRSFGPSLCYTCHEKLQETIKDRPFVHGPTAAGMCIVCHEPHGSVERFLLRKKTDRLCLSCHQDFVQVLAMDFLHGPVESGECTGCHDPHASVDQKQLVAPKANLCEKCHDIGSMLHMHRVGDEPNFSWPAGTPVDAEGPTTCYTCHLYHGSKLANLWRGEEEGECGIGCHTEPQE